MLNKALATHCKKIKLKLHQNRHRSFDIEKKILISIWTCKSSIHKSVNKIGKYLKICISLDSQKFYQGIYTMKKVILYAYKKYQRTLHEHNTIK